jgi:anthranilate phosphoribosyltransferase
MQTLIMQPLINELIEQRNLTFEQSSEFFNLVMTGQVSEIELSAALIALKIKGETDSEIAGAAKAMRDNAVSFNNPCSVSFDSCGTGGDGANSINVSTTAALVAASMGVNMVKHGNRSVSSQSGSSDLLNALGININMSVAQAEQCLAATRFTFLFAPLYHAGVKHAMPVRTTLKTRTLFNILGPLANPAKPSHQLLGVYTPSLLRPMAQTLKLLGCKRAMVIHGAGTDEIALHGTTQVAELRNGEIHEYSLTPSDFGLDNFALSAIEGAEPEYNAAASLAILQGEGAPAHNAAIAANVAAMLVMQGDYNSFIEATSAVLEHLKKGLAFKHLQQIIEVSNG